VSGVSFGKGKKQKRKPNVVFIITDDQKLDSFGFINKKAMTPNIDRIAKEGVYFSKGYASTSVCTPSRYTCLTGRYASRSQVGKFINGITDEGQTWVQWNADMAQSETNIPKVMKANGYVTGVVGKLHGFEVAGHNKKLNKKSDAHDPEVIKMPKEDQKIIAEDLKNHGFDYAARLHRANLGSTKSLPEEICKHAPEWTVEGALNFIEANKDKPFYLYYATTLLHGPNPLESLKSDPRISEEGFLKEPPKVMPSRQSVLDRVKKAGISESLAPATWLDDSIGAILDKLDELDLTEDTLVIYFNDNAVEGGKGSLYEGGVSTPVMIRWPGKIKPAENKELVSNIDFAPTIFGACGITAPEA
ncbi:MAG: sulfatase-like hydrolase/transferase, partial [Planctomycetes bacterium]|nr:sulfatase-like hydrolase/transferase [Planctomycetota bacterium]